MTDSQCRHNQQSPDFDAAKRQELNKRVKQLPLLRQLNPQCPFCAYERGWNDAIAHVIERLASLQQ